MTVEEIAQVCHEINMAYCDALGDNSQKSWTEAEDWQKESAINGVKYLLMTPYTQADALHKNWLAEKAAGGWKLGPVKDAEKKEHPCFVPFEELPVEQQAKDHLFRQVVLSLKGQLSPLSDFS